MANPQTYIIRNGGDAQLENLEILGGVLAGTLQTDDVSFNAQTLTATGAINPDVSTVFLSHPTTIIAATLAAPMRTRLLIIANTSASGTAAHTVTLPTGVTWDGTNRVATLNAPGEALVCIAISATRYLVLVNLGSVAFS